MFWGIEDEELDALYDVWMDERYFDRLLLGVGLVLYLLFATPRGLEIVFAPLLMPFYLWGILPLPC